MTSLPLPRSLLVLALVGLASGCNKNKTNGDDTDDPGRHITEHCGTILGEETWSAAENIHLVTCDIVVNGILNIEGGAEVFLEEGTTVRVEGGQLRANGEPNAQIIFESYAGNPNEGDHGGILATNGNVELYYFTLRHGGMAGPLVDLNGGTADLVEVTLSNGPGPGLRATGTSFSRLEGVSVAYVTEPLLIPWAAAGVMTGVSFDSVDSPYIRLNDATLAEHAVIPVQYDEQYNPLTYVSAGVEVLAGGGIELTTGALVEMEGDIDVHGSIILYGSYADPVGLMAHEENGTWALRVHDDAETITFRFARIEDATVEAAAEGMYFRDTDIRNAPGDALTITGSIKDNDTTNFDGNTFTGSGYGLVVGIEDLVAVGSHNETDGSAFSGIAILGGALEESLTLESVPLGQMAVLGDIYVYSGALTIAGGTVSFEDEVGLYVDGGALLAESTVFKHVGEEMGGWEGIRIGPSTGTSVIEGCEIAHGGDNGGANITIEGDATIRTTTIRDSAGWGILLVGDADPTLEDVTFSGNLQGDVGP